MDLPTVTVARDARQANQHLQQTGEQPEQRDMAIPRITTRAAGPTSGNASASALWPAPLRSAVPNGSFKLVSLLLEDGARPDGSDALVDESGAGMNINTVRERLNAGADPWQSIGRPEQLPTDGRHVSIAEFYKQTGLNINVEARVWRKRRHQ